MDDLYDALAAGTELSSVAARELDERGFVVLPGPVEPADMERVANAYDAMLASASGQDVRAGSTTTRVNDFVNRGNAFDALYVFPPLLEACCRTIGGAFKLSSLHARSACISHRDTLALGDKKRRDARGGIRRIVPRQQDARGPIDDVMLHLGRSIGDDRHTRGHEIQAGKRAGGVRNTGPW